MLFAVLVMSSALMSVESQHAQAPSPQRPSELLIEAPAEETIALTTVPTTKDQNGRVIARVAVDGRTDLRFLVDTGANRSALSTRLARTMALQPLGEARVHGALGEVQAPIVRLREVEFGAVRWREREAPVLDANAMGRADGLIGMDGLADHRLDVDFGRGEVSITKSRKRSPRDREIARLDVRFGHLVVAQAEIGGVDVWAIIDTGAERSMINAPLVEALAARGRNVNVVQVVDLLGVGGPDAPGLKGFVINLPSVKIGDVTLRRIAPVTGDFHIFRVWNFQNTPAIVLGMDVLGRFGAIAIDYPARRFEMRMCTPREPCAG
jgi:predicted aspartyl protease